MEDVTDPAFRLMCKKFGADMVYTEFVSADALIRSVGKTMQKLNINDEERPVAIQIIVDLAEQLQDCGIEALTIHGRTRAQMYTGEADWSLIGEVKKNPRMHIPIIGNGDITTPQRAKECFDQYGVDAIMIGRASFGRPWIFKEVKHYIETGKELPALSFEWRLNVLRQEVLDSVNLLDERRGILHVRRHLAASPLFKGIPNFKETRIAMLRAETVKELFSILDYIRGNYGMNS
jgi:tRNA-dihydrouridine synthase